jgi:cytochrome c6
MKGAGYFYSRRIGMLWRMAKLCVLLAVSSGIVAGCSQDGSQKPAEAPSKSALDSREPVRDGAALFKRYCSVCHPDGGNFSDPERALYGSVLKRNHITTPEDIVRIMRKPLSRMIRFDASTLPEKDARAIAEYVLKTFR